MDKQCPMCDFLLSKLDDAKQKYDTLLNYTVLVFLLGVGMSVFTYMIGTCVGR